MTGPPNGLSAPSEREPGTKGPHTAIRGGRSPLALGYAEVWRHRDLLWLFFVRDFKLRYRQTILGGFWVLLAPLLGAAVFAFVFGSVAKLPSQGTPYFIFAFAGLLAWNMFSNGLTRAGTSLVDNSALVSKVYFPRLLLPAASVLSGLVDAGVGLVLLLALLAASGLPITMSIVLAPAWICLLGALSLGFGLLVAALMVSFRDVKYGLPILLQILLYVSPVVYPSSAVPKWAKPLIELNPLSALIEGSRSALIGTPSPNLGRVVYSLVATVASLLLGTLAFRAMERRFADVI